MKSRKKRKVWIGYVPDREHWKHLFYWWEQDATYRVKFLGIVGGVSHKKIQKHRTRNWEHQTKIRIIVEEL